LVCDSIQSIYKKSRSLRALKKYKKRAEDLNSGLGTEKIEGKIMNLNHSFTIIAFSATALMGLYGYIS